MELLEKIQVFLDAGGGDGYGYGDGYGDGDGHGYGNGNGDGDGYGYGDGYGDGDGHGNGDGDGDGYGNGDGYGDGDGYGNGYGDGYGYGNGDGIKELNGVPIYKVDGVPTAITNVKGQLATGFTIRRNVKLIPCYIARVGNYFGHGETAHDAMKAAREKYEENRPLSERIDDFVKEFPSLDTTGTGKRFYEWHHILTGSCEFGRNEFCKAHGVGMDTTYTVGYFLNLVRNDFGSDAIREVLKRFNEQSK